jgi:hypothetical protein
MTPLSAYGSSSQSRTFGGICEGKQEKKEKRRRKRKKKRRKSVDV